jgi:hypothetical protein
MGNRAVISTEDKQIGVYLHWNGGRDSVEAFLTYCKLKGYRPPEQDSYGWARLCQVIGNFFGGTNSLGIDKFEKLDYDNWNNGTYIIKNWEIIDRQYIHSDDDYEFEEQQEYDLKDMLLDINDHQPTHDQLPIATIEGYLKIHS